MPDKKTVQRFDQSVEPDWLTTKFEKTDEGYLTGRAVLTNVGVFTYVIDGEIVRELRLPEDVFSYETMKSLEMVPVTLDHPEQLLDAENVKDLQVGHTGNTPSRFRSPDYGWVGESDGFHVTNEVVISDAEAVKSVEMGKRALSCGYTADVEFAEEGSVWCGIGYDAIQRNIRYNHVAIVDKARAGDAAKIRLDSVDIRTEQSKEDEMADLKKTILDGVEYQAEAEVIKTMNGQKVALDAATTEIAESKTANSKLEGERDTLKDENDALKAKIVELEKNDVSDEEIQKRVDSYLAVQSVAEKVGVEVLDTMTEADLMSATIMKRHPNAKLDGKDATYVQARFDGIAEMIDDEVDGDAEARKVANDSSDTSDDEHDANEEKRTDSVEVKRQKMIERNQKAHIPS